LWGGHPRESSIDVLSGGDGNDVFFVHNELAAKKDIVLCGDGRDQVLADRADVLRPNCERVVVVHGSPEDIELQAAKFSDSIQRFYKGIRFPGDEELISRRRKGQGEWEGASPTGLRPCFWPLFTNVVEEEFSEIRRGCPKGSIAIIVRPVT
jgi:hypothetical protein